MRKFLVIAACLLGLASCSSPSGQKIELFNGQDLNDWVAYVDPAEGVPTSKVFSVKDGMLRIEGQPFGYIRTKAEYTDYTIHVEWRWAGEPSNSGIFNRVQGPDQVWPFAVESNLMHGGVGHYVGLGGCKFDGGSEAYQDGEFYVLKATGDQSAEKATGEWNTSEVIVKGETIVSYLNGKKMNEVGGFKNDKGYIALQSEGGPIEFRSVYITVE